MPVTNDEFLWLPVTFEEWHGRPACERFTRSLDVRSSAFGRFFNEGKARLKAELRTRSIAMRKNELRELVRSGEFISGIYNYCDRWCERCPLTARCLVYATEKADDDLADPEVHD